MEQLATKIATPTRTTPSKHNHHNHNHQSVTPLSENRNPNSYGISCNSTNTTTTPSSLKKHSKSPKPAPVVRSPQNRIRQRKFLVAKKNNTNKDDAVCPKTVSCKCKEKGESFKCLCVAYENLRASQEEFFNNRETKNSCDDKFDEDEEAENAFIEASLLIQDLRIDEANDEERGKFDDDGKDEEGDNSACVKRRRAKLLEDARNSVPESGSGRVMHLVKAFEKLLSMPKSNKEHNKKQEDEEEEGNEKNKSRVMKWALPGLQFEQSQPPNDPEIEDSGSSLLCAQDLILTSENLGLDSRVPASSWDISSRGSVSSRNSSAGRRSRRNSLESCSTLGGRRWKQKKQLKVTSQKPFKLRTEQRGKSKEEVFKKKVQEMVTEEQKMRIRTAQGLPWTTDEPECLAKPPVKESTRPIDLKLHSDVRAIDRAEFDQQVAEKMSLIEQLKLERERQQKLADEEEIRRLRKELIPKAQPMPYFDRPFVPRRSMKHPTIPREPKFHIPQHKKIKCCLSLNGMNPYSAYLN